jgi:hypothetical protein
MKTEICEKKALERKSRSYVKKNYLHYTNYKMIMSVCRYPEQLSKNDLCRIINLTALPTTFKKIVKQKCNLPQSESEYDKCHPTEYNRDRDIRFNKKCAEVLQQQQVDPAEGSWNNDTFPRKKLWKTEEW